MRESSVEAHLVSVVKLFHGVVRKAKWIGRRGCPDRYVLLPVHGPRRAMQIWVELKRPGKDAEDHQRREHELLREYGCTVVVLDTCEKINDYFLNIHYHGTIPT